MPVFRLRALFCLPMLSLCLLLITPQASAVRLSMCQGNFEAIRGPAYQFALQSAPVNVDPLLVRDIEMGARGIYQHWEALLAAPVPFVVDVRLELFADAGAFRQRKQSLVPELPEVTGFYAWEPRLAVALLDASSVESRHRALHEISHLITVSQLGGAPHWLAEGLAEVHETIVVTPHGPEFHVNPRHRRWLAVAAAPSLTELFEAPYTAWTAFDSQRLYALSWSLMYFLLQSSEGRGALGFTLQQASTHSCGSYDAGGFLVRSYPGGAAALQRDWADWLRSV
ncbi:hypothetical protein A3709_05690 [Halioglobus sp. HI00S01]|uniref:hypothetical protein n=1 Tax=Halioglobus sp. HI00S01 TaxID=1822214 RepID=UPI0007C3134C|nr:hypothetical protein [Halioglobus sp. HI00S01]KZX56588.1 hypothetical protein A3709_05690 [Halioglobus sp. HI00S01]